MLYVTPKCETYNKTDGVMMKYIRKGNFTKNFILEIGSSVVEPLN